MNNRTNKTPARVWSPFQNAVFAGIDAAVKAKEGDNLTVLARAGSGKTSTIIEAINRLPRGVKALAVAFNKSIAVELKEKMPGSQESATLHSAGFKIVRREYPKIRVDKDKAFDHAENVLRAAGRVDPRTFKPKRSEVFKVAKASQVARETLSLNPRDLQELVFKLDLNRNGEDFPLEKFCEAVIATVDSMLTDTKRLDFSDMVFLPVHHGWKLPIYDLVIVDEAQDMNKAQLSLAQSLAKPNGTIVIVGDDMQAIYGFRGADSGAIGRMTAELGAQVYPLSVSYRCPQAVIKLAQTVCPDIQPSPSAIEGSIRGIDISQVVKQAGPGDFILSRTNAPLASMCLSLLSHGIPAIIAGRDIGARLANTVERSKTRTIGELLYWTEDYQEAELLKLSSLNFRSEEARESKEQEIRDLVNCLHALADGFRPSEPVSSLVDRIESLFSDADPMTKVICSTVHKAKGRERDRVFMLDNTFRKNANKEEARIWYVAVTRAKRELVRVSSPKS